ncbi:MAG: hypothetical protein QXU18_01310 [Thermoplasmatales archaeon]
MRYAELQRFRENLDWLGGIFVYLPRGSMLKVKAKQRKRAIRLSGMGKTLVPDLFQSSYPLPDLPALDMKLRRLSKKILEGSPINNKTFRKTWESWLVFYYPDKALQTALSQRHTTTTQYEHHLNMPFEEEDLTKQLRETSLMTIEMTFSVKFSDMEMEDLLSMCVEEFQKRIREISNKQRDAMKSSGFKNRAIGTGELDGYLDNGYELVSFYPKRDKAIVRIHA